MLHDNLSKITRDDSVDPVVNVVEDLGIAFRAGKKLDDGSSANKHVNNVVANVKTEWCRTAARRLETILKQARDRIAKIRASHHGVALEASAYRVKKSDHFTLELRKPVLDHGVSPKHH